MTMAALEDHFARVADASSLPVILYSVPANTSIDIPVELVRRLGTCYFKLVRRFRDFLKHMKYPTFYGIFFLMSVLFLNLLKDKLA